MLNAGAQWLRERTRDFRDRAEQVTDENTRARLLRAAVIYEREADLIEAKAGPVDALAARLVLPANMAPA
jgi:hypothetical protein